MRTVRINDPKSTSSVPSLLESSKRTRASLRHNFNRSYVPTGSSSYNHKDFKDFESTLKEEAESSFINKAKAELNMSNFDSIGKYKDKAKMNSFNKWLNKDADRSKEIRQMTTRLPPLKSAGSNMSNIFMSNNDLNQLQSKVEEINLEPMANADEMFYVNRINQRRMSNYHRMRVLFTLNFFISLCLIVFEVSAIVIGVVFMNRCEMVDIYLVVSGCFHILIIVIEWSRTWIWSSVANNGPAYINADHMQVFLTVMLIGLYIFAVIWFSVGFTWIPSVFLKFLKSGVTYDEELIVKQGDKYIPYIVPNCSVSFYTYAVSYQVVIGMLLLLRLSYCFVSDFCRSVCNKLVNSNNTGLTDKDDSNYMLQLDSSVLPGTITTNPMCSIPSSDANILETYLPPIRSGPYIQRRQFSSRHQGSQNDNFYGTSHYASVSGPETGLYLLHNYPNLKIVTPIPLYSGGARNIDGLDQNNKVPEPKFDI